MSVEAEYMRIIRAESFYFFKNRVEVRKEGSGQTLRQLQLQVLQESSSKLVCGMGPPCLETYSPTERLLY